MGKSIRSLCIFDPSNRPVFQWRKGKSIDKDWSERFEKALASGPLSKTIQQLIKEVNLDTEKTRVVEFEGRNLSLHLHGWFLIVADSDSKEEFDKVIPQLLAAINDAISEDPLSFSGLLSHNDMPGRSKLAAHLAKVLGS
jgi:hypothetical protein